MYIKYFNTFIAIKQAVNKIKLKILFGNSLVQFTDLIHLLTYYYVTNF